MKNHLYTYRILSVDRVVDGDTIDLTLDLGFYLTKRLRVRMADYDAPEIYHPSCKEEYEAGIRVTEHLQKLITKHLAEGYTLIAKTFPWAGIYGRFTAWIYAVKGNDVVCLNDEVKKFMINNHLTKEELANGANTNC